MVHADAAGVLIAAIADGGAGQAQLLDPVADEIVQRARGHARLDQRPDLVEDLRGEAADLGGELSGGYYIKPTIFKGNNKMRIFQEEIFGPVVSLTSFADEAEALQIANDTLYGLGAGVWSRSAHTTFAMGRGIQAGRVWTNCYHQYPAHAAFGGYKKSGVGRETHKVALEHYQQTKNLLVSYDINPLGFF